MVHYRIGETVGRIPLAPLAVGAGSVRGEDLTAALAGLPAGSHDLGLSLDHDGAPGSLVAELLLVEPDGRSVVPATPKDVEGESAVGMTFAWRLTEDASTVIALANPSMEAEVDCHLFLFFDGKTYTWDGDEFLKPGEVRHIDIRRLRDEQIPGQDGALLPLDVMAGQAKAIVRNEPGQNHKILGQAISMGSHGPAVSSLGCVLCPPDPWYVALSPLSFTGAIGTNKQIYPWLYWLDGSSLLNGNPYAISWYPGNSSVATVSEAWNNFRVQFQGPGTTTIDAEMPNECHYQYDYFYGGCVCAYYLPVWAAAAAQVQSVCAIPTNFHTISVTKPTNGRLVFTYQWSSSTGKQSDLSACTVGESVFYPGSNNPYVWPLPMVQSTVNPTVISAPGSNSVIVDTNYPPNSYQQPYSSASFNATQRFWWTCPCYQNGDLQFFGSDITITRSVFKDSDNKWKYKIQKSGETNTVVLPGQ